MAKVFKRVARRGVKHGKCYSGIIGRKGWVDAFNRALTKGHDLSGARRRLDKRIIREDDA